MKQLINIMLVFCVAFLILSCSKDSKNPISSNTLSQPTTDTTDDQPATDTTDDTSANQPPTKPSGFYASAISSSQIDLRWNATSSPINGYKIERSQNDENSYSEITTTVSNVVEFSDMDLIANTKYYYRIRAFNEFGDSEYSDAYWAETLIFGFGLCANKTTGYSCYRPECYKIATYSSLVEATGAEVLECLQVDLVTSATMTITFSYKASASTCYEPPYLNVISSDWTESYPFDCNVSGDDTVSVVIASDQTIGDLSFKLFSGDWASSVMITSITFTP